MTIEIVVGGQSLKPILNGPPKITDQLNAVCRTLQLPVQGGADLSASLGQPVELFYKGKRWFFGYLFKEGTTHEGKVSYTAYDPLYFMKRNKDDFYYNKMTATQAFKDLAENSAIRIASLANTGVTLPALFYPGTEADKVGIDLLVRTHEKTTKRYWFKYKPDYKADGLELFEKKVPTKVWAFTVGVNLERAYHERSIEETATVVKLINRETGRVVTKVAQEELKQYGQLKHSEEVDKDTTAVAMEKKAADLLKNLKKVNATMLAEGVNSNGVMPQFFSGDIIYVEEPRTKLAAGYYIRNVNHVFENDNLIRLAFDIQAVPDLPALIYTDAADKGAEKAAKARVATQAKAKPGVSGTNDEEIKRLIAKYGIVE